MERQARLTPTGGAHQLAPLRSVLQAVIARPAKVWRGLGRESPVAPHPAGAGAELPAPARPARPARPAHPADTYPTC